LVAAAGVPASVAVPLPLSTKVTPVGSAPDSVIVGVGLPVVVTEKKPAAPTVNVALEALVIAGVPTTPTVRVKLWTAVERGPFVATIAIG